MTEFEVSVIIPVHNKEQHLKRSIDSVLNQSHQDFELLLIDDASTDGSWAIIEEYEHLENVCIHIRTQPGAGGYAARNLGVEKAQYRWVAFLDADDAWHVDYLRQMKQLHEQFPDQRLLGSPFSIVDEAGERVSFFYKKDTNQESRVFSLTDFLNGVPFCTDTVVMEKLLIEQSGGFPEGAKRGGDIDTWLRCMMQAKSFAYVPFLGAIYYRDSENMVTAKKVNVAENVVHETVENLLAENELNSDIQRGLKRFSNRYQWSGFKSLARLGQLKRSHLKYYYKGADKTNQQYQRLSILALLPSFLQRSLVKRLSNQ